MQCPGIHTSVIISSLITVVVIVIVVWTPVVTTVVSSSTVVHVGHFHVLLVGRLRCRLKIVGIETVGSISISPSSELVWIAVDSAIRGVSTWVVMY